MKASQKLKIKGLEVEIERAIADFNAKTVPVRQALELEWDKIFTESVDVIKAIESLENSREYAFNEIGDLMRWVRIDVKALSQGNVEQLERYFSNEGLTLDVKNECLMALDGGYIGIDAETGDIWSNDCGRTESIASGSDYETIEERNALIEAYMERTGVYPTVVMVGRYRDATLVNTTKKSA